MEERAHNNDTFNKTNSGRNLCLRIAVIRSTIPLMDIINAVIISFVALSLILIWFQSGMLLASRDIGLTFYNPTRWFEIVKYVWFDLQSTGHFFPQTMFIPLAGGMALLQHIGLSPVTIEKMLFYLCLTLNGLSMYYLTSVLINGKERPMASLLSGLFYMLNPYVMFHVWYRFTSSIWTMWMIPVLLALYIRGIERKKFTYAFLMGIISSVWAASFCNPAYIIVIVLVLLSYLLFHMLCSLKKVEIVYALKFTATLLVLWIALNLWWFLPWILTWGPTYQAQVTIVDQASFNTFLDASKLYGLSYILRLIRKTMWDWKPFYSSDQLLSISFIVPIIVFSMILLKPKNKFVLYFVSLALFGLFLGKGYQPPFENFSLWLFNNVPLFIVFRNPFEKAGAIVTLSYSFLFGVGLVSLYYLFINRKSTCTKPFKSRFYPVHVQKIFAVSFILIVCFTSFGILVWPMWNGNIFTHDPRRSWGNVDMHVEVPFYYKQADEWLCTQSEDFRILVLPMSPYDGNYYNWQHGYAGKDPAYTLFGKPTIAMKTYNPTIDGITLRLPNLLASSIHEADKLKLLSLLNVKYVLINYDINSTHLGIMYTPEDYEKVLVGKPDENRAVTLSNADSLEDWNSGWKTKLFLDYKVAKEGNASLRAYTTLESGRYKSGFKYDPAQTLDLSNYDFICFWLKIDKTEGIQQIGFYIYDESENWRLWQVYFPTRLKESILQAYEEGMWQYVALPLAKPHYQSTVPASLSSVDYIYIALISETEVPIESTNLWIDDLRVVPAGYYKLQTTRYGNLTFYEVDERWFAPRIYVANLPISVKDLDEMFIKIKTDEFAVGRSVIFVEEQLEPGVITELEEIQKNIDPNLRPHITFEKIDPTRYWVKVENASSPFFLVFSETYDPMWNAYINGKRIEEHYIANGYANAWYISKVGSYEITIEFWGQKLFHYSIAVSLIASVLVVFYLSIRRNGSHETS